MLGNNCNWYQNLNRVNKPAYGSDICRMISKTSFSKWNFMGYELFRKNVNGVVGIYSEIMCKRSSKTL